MTEENSNDLVNSGNQSNNEGPPALPFVTTSTVLNQLNDQLKKLSLPEDSLEPKFELQRRLPDGSTIPASKADIEYSDLQTKLQQSAVFVANLDPSDRLVWAEAQRQAGNSYFSAGDYKTAMDTYLTCLVVKEESVQFVRSTLIPVLNNLAQCTLQLSMRKKTIEFCQIALEEMDKFSQDLIQTDDWIARCKIHFKLGKAQRLTGHYRASRSELGKASHCLVSLTTAKDGIAMNAHDVQTMIAPFEQAIEKEISRLDISEESARKNIERQKRAMQQVLSSSNASRGAQQASNAAGSSVDATGHTKNERDHSHEQPEPIREYSSLRIRKKDRSEKNETPSKINNAPGAALETSQQMSYAAYYWSVVARVAETILLWLGDEDTMKEVKKRQEEK
eukprot:Nitzschia sp. Nitz4//scaffold73_size107353//3397//4572//NITZ4_004305-RA/size107353-processed-gene-0.158-mRNA-1//1//CDS//3329557431//1597//frame0